MYATLVADDNANGVSSGRGNSHTHTLQIRCGFVWVTWRNRNVIWQNEHGKSRTEAAKMSTECSTKLIAQRGRRELREAEGRRRAGEKPTNLMNSPDILDKCSFCWPKHLAACLIGAGAGQGVSQAAYCLWPHDTLIHNAAAQSVWQSSWLACPAKVTGCGRLAKLLPWIFHMLLSFHWKLALSLPTTHTFLHMCRCACVCCVHVSLMTVWQNRRMTQMSFLSGNCYCGCTHTRTRTPTRTQVNKNHSQSISQGSYSGFPPCDDTLQTDLKLKIATHWISKLILSFPPVFPMA